MYKIISKTLISSMHKYKEIKRAAQVADDLQFYERENKICKLTALEIKLLVDQIIVDTLWNRDCEEEKKELYHLQEMFMKEY